MAIFVFLAIVIIIILRSEISIPIKKSMSNNTLAILTFLQEQGLDKKFTVHDIQRTLDIENLNSIIGSLTGLANKGLVKRMSIYEKGKEIKYVQITIEGLNYNITKRE